MKESSSLQYIIVALVLIVTGVFSVLRAYRSLKPNKSSGCNGGCTSCPLKQPCNTPHENIKHN